MKTPDLINGSFEFIGAILTWRNVLQLYRDKQVKGVFWPVWAFFAVWGVWNCVYYPLIDQPVSFAGGVLLALGNVVWTCQAWYYSRMVKR